MAIQLSKGKRRDPNVTTLPIPVGHGFVERYRRIQQMVDKGEYEETLHDMARERLNSLLDEVEDFLESAS